MADHGAVADGVTDATAAFNAAFAAAAAANATCVRVPAAAAGRGYVLRGTVAVPQGMKLLGEPFGMLDVRAVWKGADPNIVGAKIFARPARQKVPLFTMGPGSAARGLWITYDQRPMPPDEAFTDRASPFYYATFAEARAGFIADHVGVFGPTFYCEGGRQVLEDLIGDRYTDLIYFAANAGGQASVRRVHGYGYGRTVTVVAAEDVIHLEGIATVPNVGPLSPGGPFAPYGNATFRTVFGIIASQPDSVAVWLGRSDGYVARDLFAFGVHTLLRLGYTAPSGTVPLYDWVKDAAEPALGPSAGPWGSADQLMSDQAAACIHLVWPTTLNNRLSNVQLHPSFDDGTRLSAVRNGSGDVGRPVARAAGVLVEASHALANSNGRLPVLMVSNLGAASFTDSAAFGAAAADLGKSNGRLFVADGDVAIEVGNFNPMGLAGYGTEADYLWAAGSGCKRLSLRARGVVMGDTPADDVNVQLTPQPTSR